MSSGSVSTQLFQFVQLRSAEPADETSLFQNYIRDDQVKIDQDSGSIKYIEADISSEKSASRVGRTVFKEVFDVQTGKGNSEDKSGAPANLIARNLQIIRKIIGILPSAHATLPDGIPDQAIIPANNSFRLNGRLYYGDLKRTVLIPEQIHDLGFKNGFDTTLEKLLNTWKEKKGQLEPLNPARKETLEKFDKVFGEILGKSVADFVLQKKQYSEEFEHAKRILFDALYALYVLKRIMDIDLTHVIEALRLWHVLDRVVVSSYAAGQNIELTGSASKLLKASASATPVVHPIFARLMYFRFPFNDIKPIGIGDLKVVKQKLLKYQAGEIAYVETVLKSEKRERSYRTLDRSEDTYSYSSTSKESSTRDLQSTDRFELKREVENVIKNELGVGANVAITYNGMPVVANLTSNFNYKHDQTETNKTAATLSKDVVSKAVQQVERNVAESRTVVRISEKEEQTRHVFENNAVDARNISGIYRWLDKKYEAQLYNFGRRMMFEFVVPEPAAFFVESRIRQFEIVNNPPVVPVRPTPKTINLGFSAANIDLTKFNQLSAIYDLTSFAFPPERKHIQFIDQTSGAALFKTRVADSEYWNAYSFQCDIGAKGYSFESIYVVGRIHFWGQKEGLDASGQDNWQINTFQISVDGQVVVNEVNNDIENWVYNQNVNVRGHNPFINNSVSVVLGFFDLADFQLSVSGTLYRSPECLLEWQNTVYDHITKIELENIRHANEIQEDEYQRALAAYNRSVDELKTVVVNDLLQGGASSYNQEIIQIELKKHCLTMMTKEYDDDSSNDLISNIKPIATQKGPFDFHALTISSEGAGIRMDGNYRKPGINSESEKTSSSSSANGESTLHFDNRERNIDYPAIDIPKAREKGRHVQFLEQAFEWQQLASIFYPYFWADRPKWIEMMNRSDKGDPNLTAFLRAGSVRILLPVTPAYENAILHYLATREPWDGGPAPVIGDPLFIPIYEELRKQQDDIFNAIAEGDPWTFTLPTSHVYLEEDSTTLPSFEDEQD